jgi:HSP20 family protein
MLKDLELLYSPLDDIFDSFSKALFDKVDTIGHYSFMPYITSNNFHSIFDNISFPDYEPTVKYPVANCYIEENGNCILEIAVTGFSKENINITREGNVITIRGEENTDRDGNTKEDKRKYLFRRLAKRNFEVSYKMSDKLDFSKINTSMENGILKISIPMKENEKVVSEKILIK